MNARVRGIEGVREISSERPLAKGPRPSIRFSNRRKAINAYGKLTIDTVRAAGRTRPEVNTDQDEAGLGGASKTSGAGLPGELHRVEVRSDD